MHVYVDADAFVATPCGAHGEVGHLRTNAGEGYEAFYCVGDLGIELVAEDLSGLLDVFSFEVVESDFVDEAVELGGLDGENGLEIEALLVLVDA